MKFIGVMNIGRLHNSKRDRWRGRLPDGSTVNIGKDEAKQEWARLVGKPFPQTMNAPVAIPIKEG